MDARGSVFERFASGHNLEGRTGVRRIGSADTSHTQFGDAECFLVGDMLDNSRGDLSENPVSNLPSLMYFAWDAKAGLSQLGIAASKSFRIFRHDPHFLFRGMLALAGVDGLLRGDSFLPIPFFPSGYGWMSPVCPDDPERL